MNNQYKRTTDNSIYLREDRFQNVKEHFKQVASLLSLDTKNYDSSKKLIDIGGATGEFVYFIRSLQPDMEISLVEYSQVLIDASRSRLSEKNISVVRADANDLQHVLSDYYDFVTTLGVTSIFDDFRPSFNEMIRVAANGALCLNSMLVNQYDVDVIIKYINPTTGELESGWNKFSLKSIGTFLEQHPDVASYRFEKHVMPFDIEPRTDLMRSWTRFNEKGERILWNGLDMEISIYHIIFEIRK